jgi:hypothetical protein
MTMKSIAIYAALLAAPVSAQECAGYADVVGGLSSRWQEELAIRATNPDTTVTEMWGNEATGSWTYLLILPDGRACLMASGTDFTRYQAKPNT